MRIQIAKRNVEVSETLRAHVGRRCRFAFGRLADRIERVLVRFSDINGDRGGLDKRCQIEVEIRPIRTVRVEDTDTDLFAAVNRAAARAARSIARTVERDHGIVVPPPRHGVALDRRRSPELR